MVLLHVLLAKLVKQLGINAARYGIPMIFRLQEDIQDAETPISKVRIGSLCHGYFWTLNDIFNIEPSVVGRAIHNEIMRRRSKHFWIEGIHIPAPLLELIGTPGIARPQPRMPMKEIESEALLPFDDRISLIECICTSYQESVASPPASPATSPGRSFNHPILGSTASSVPAIETTENELPIHFREQMLTEWSREAVFAAIQAESKSASLNGSRTGTTGTGRNRLGVNGLAVLNGHAASPSPAGSHANLRPVSSPAGPGGNATLQNSKLRQTSVRSNVSRPAPPDTAVGVPPAVVPAGANGPGLVTSVDQLKLALSGQLQPPPSRLYTGVAAGNILQRDDESTDSMASYDSPSELSFNPATAETGTSIADQAKDNTPPYSAAAVLAHERKPSAGGGPLTSHPTTHDGDLEEDGREPVAEEVPPVPPLPSGLEHKAAAAASLEPPAVAASRPATAKRTLKSRGGDSLAPSSWGGAQEAQPAAMDLQSLLLGIDSRAGENNRGNVSKPPY